MSRTLAVLAAFGLAVGAAGRTDAGPIYTYTFTTDVEDLGPAFRQFPGRLKPHRRSGNTDISNFITDIDFTIAGLTFTTPNFKPADVTVTSAGDLTMGAGLTDSTDLIPNSIFPCS